MWRSIHKQNVRWVASACDWSTGLHAPPLSEQAERVRLARKVRNGFFFFSLVCVHVRKVHANCRGNIYVDLEIHNDGEIVVTQSNTKQEAGNLLRE